MRLFLLVILASSFHISSSQGFVYPVIQPTAQTIGGILPPGWSVLDSAYGDLNKDGKPDVAIVLQLQDSVYLVNDIEDTVLTQPRILLILFSDNQGNGYRRIEQSNSFILKHDNSSMDDPFSGISIKNAVLQIDFTLFYNMGSWYTSNSSYKFRYNGKAFELIGADKYSVHRASLDFESFSYNFLTKKRIKTTGNEGKGTKKQYPKVIKVPSPITLATFKAPYTWEVEKDIFL